MFWFNSCLLKKYCRDSAATAQPAQPSKFPAYPKMRKWRLRPSLPSPPNIRSCFVGQVLQIRKDVNASLRLICTLPSEYLNLKPVIQLHMWKYSFCLKLHWFWDKNKKIIIVLKKPSLRQKKKTQFVRIEKRVMDTQSFCGKEMGYLRGFSIKRFINFILRE